jgi:type IV pilus biogenesis protein CpaD/CtpE
MHRANDKSISGVLGCAALLSLLTACADRSSVRVAPTAAMPCPPWVEFPADAHSNGDSPYLGCVNAVNLGNMLVDSTDLTRGRPLGPASGAREALGIDLYDKGKINAPKSSGGAAPTIIMPGGGDTGTQ